jgi:exosortase K
MGDETLAPTVRTVTRQRIHSAVVIVAMLAITYALKRHYSTADAEALQWILAPTAWLVEAVFRAPFVFEQRVGYVNTELRFAIAPSCAGVNFMIIAICTAAVGFVSYMRTLRAKLALLFASVALAYVATLGVNAARIVVALLLQAHPVSVAGLSSGQLHHAEGIVVYYTSLCALYVLADRIFTWARPKVTT